MEAVIMTHAGAGTPHREALERWNPGMRVHVAVGPAAVDEAERLKLWRNGDRRIREWWRIYRPAVKSEWVCFLEYDVLANADLSVLAGAGGADLIGRKVESRASDWPWWKERGRLPWAVGAHASGLAPLACLVIRRRVLDAILRPIFDVSFRRDIFCELRLPSVVVSAGFRLGSHELLKGCRWYGMEHPGDRPGVWHAVKRARV